MALSKVDGEAKVKLQVQYAAEDAGVKDENAIKNLQDAAIATFKNNEEKRESIKPAKMQLLQQLKKQLKPRSYRKDY